MNNYDYLIVGAGLFGAVFAHEATKAGKKCLVLDKRNHTGGNVYCENIEEINVHKYGAHIFHTNDKGLWDYVNQFVEFNNYINSPLAYSKGKLYNLPFNMNTFYQLWGTRTPQEAKEKIEEQIAIYGTENPANLEEQALSLVGKDIYENFIKEYTEKQPGKVKALVEDSKHFTDEALIQYYEAMIARPDRTVVLKTFERPILFLIGEHDPAVPLQSSLQPG